MSTYWYPFKETISSIRLEKTPGHDVLHIWQRGGKCGVLTLDKDSGMSIAALFREDMPALHVWKSPNGLKIKKCDGYKESSTYLMNEYGEVYSLSQILRSGEIED